MEMLWLTVVVGLLVADVQSCQQPLLPVYNTSAKRYLTCNSWEPDCPEDTVCQRATGEWKERLYTNPEFVLYLCCNKDGRLKTMVEPEMTTQFPVLAPTSFPPISIPTFPPVDMVPDPIIVPLPATPMPVDGKKNEIMFENPKTNHIHYPYPLLPKPNGNQQTSIHLPTPFQQLTQIQPDSKSLPQPFPVLPTQTASQQIPAPALPQAIVPTLEVVPAQPGQQIPHVLAVPPPASPSIPQQPAHIPGPVPQFPQELPQIQSPSQPSEPQQPPTAMSQAPLTSLPPHLRLFSQQFEAQLAILAAKHAQNGQQIPVPSAPVVPVVPAAELTASTIQEQLQNGNSIFTSQPTTLSNSLSITQSQPPLPMGMPTKPGVLPSPPLGKLAALAPQPQVLAAGNGNRVILGPNICLLVLGEFSQPDKDLVFRYRGTVALIQDSGLNILVDTGSANSKNKLIAALAQQGLRPQNIQVVIYTHAHPDHMGNDNLFPYAQKFFAGAVYKGDEFLPLQQLEEPSMRLTQHVEIWKTPGHTMQHNSILVRNVSSEYVNGTVAVSGDLFLNDRGFDNPEQWQTIAVDRDVQKQLRYVLLCQADYIIPGHGKPFAVTPAMRSTANCSARKLLAYRYALARKNKKSRRKSGPLIAFHQD